MTDRGIVYVATRLDRYVEEAFLSAVGVKRQAADLHITLFTDRPHHPLCRAGVFDAVEPLAADDMIPAGGPLDRVAALARTPYELTLYLDGDTRILTPAIRGLFDRLDGFDMAMAEDSPDFSFARRTTGRRMFNCGVMLYRASSEVFACFEAWRERFGHNLMLAQHSPLPPVEELAQVRSVDDRRKMLCIDKIALMEVLRPDAGGALRVRTLDESWNFRGPNPPPAVNIAHAHERSPSTAADLVEIAYEWVKAGREDQAQAIYDYVGALKPAHQMRAYWPLAVFAGRSGEEWISPELKRADIHINYGRARDAAEILGAIPDVGFQMQKLAGYARLALADGAVPQALSLSAQAVALAPQSSYAAIIHGAALLAAGRANEATPPLTRAATVRGSAHFLLGLAWTSLGNYREAASAYREALVFDPSDPGPANNLLPALMGDRKYAAAIEYADSVMAQRPGHTAAVAFKCISLAEQGRTRDLAALIDFGLIKVEDLPVPPGYPDIAGFNRALAQEIATEPTLAYERNTTRFGYQTDDIGFAATPAVRALNEAVLAAARRRAAEVDPASAHPFAAGVPKDFRVYSWGVVMQEHGHQAPHFHPHGWLSGVYYIEVPPEIGEHDRERHGWIEFGRGDERWHRKGTAMPAHQVLPRAGVLLTFPSYFWHNTLPLRNAKRRISFAFDMIPLT